jgi:hypothetical protein
MSALFSDNFDWFLYSLEPDGGPQGNREYPGGLSWRDAREARIQGNENVHDMFVRFVNNKLGGQVSRCQIESDLAVLAFIGWRDNDVLSWASVQAIKTIGVDVPTYFAGAGNHQVQYFRLDVERRTGIMFTHPFPHAHYVPRGEIRYSLNGWQSSNVIVDFFEHIYLQCYHQVWLAWAEDAWNRHWSASSGAGAVNPFQTIVDAFRESQDAVLEEHQRDLEAIKNVLRRKKDDSYRLRVDSARCALLAYPSA